MRRLSRVLATSLAALAATMTIVVVPAGAAHAADRNPVVFVHGYGGNDWNWGLMADRFARDGWSPGMLFAWDYDTAQDNAVTARQLAAFVDQVRARTGAAKVDIVTHSMGGLSSRHYLKFLDGAAAVDDWVSIGGPNHGTNAAYLCSDRSCADMRFGSPFLTALNGGDETPGAVRYGTFWSSCDEVINPDTSTVLAGAVNHHLSGCIGHVSLLISWEVYTGVRAFIR